MKTPTARPETIARAAEYEATYDPSASIAVWARSTSPRPAGGWWSWHSVAAVSPDGATTWAVCGDRILGETTSVPTLLGHWPDLSELDDRACRECRRRERSLRLVDFAPGQVASEPVCWPQASDGTRAAVEGETR